jgi:hypothetical protein
VLVEEPPLDLVTVARRQRERRHLQRSRPSGSRPVQDVILSRAKSTSLRHPLAHVVPGVLALELDRRGTLR